MTVNVGRDHLVRLPSEFPEGPATVTVIAVSQADTTPVSLRGQGLDAERYARGEIVIADDFDAPLPTDVQREFEGDNDDRL